VTEPTLSNLLHEERRFAPPAELAAHANVTEEAYARASQDRLAFWADAAERLEWGQRWDQVLDWSNPPFAKWFTGATINASVNCVDRHVAAGRGDKVALHWVGEPQTGEPGETRDITYAQLGEEVNRASNALTELGVRKGDRVAIYMPMIPETVVAMLACARLGAPHTVVFGGFSADALASRLEDCGATVVITADGGYRRGSASALKPAVDEACAKTTKDGVSLVRRVLVVRRTGQDVEWHHRDVWWHDIVDRQSAIHEAELHDSEHPLYVMYTSGTTGKPKGILHTTGGYLVGTSYTHWSVFDLKPDTDVYWCTADVGWVTGHSYMGLRPARERRHAGDVRRHSRRPPQGSLVGDHREVRRHHLLHRAHRDPDLHEVGRRHPREVRSVLGAAARVGWRVHQPRGLHVVPRAHRWQSRSDRRHVVADRDRPDHDLSSARRHPRQTRLGHEGASRDQCRRG
jgi:acetyl-CoA synthetase